MNSLFKKFLLYNIISVGLIAGIVSFTLQASQKNLIDEKVQQVSNHSSSVNKYLSQYSYNQNIIELLQDFRITTEINSILENQNISIIILDDFKNILFDKDFFNLEISPKIRSEALTIDQFIKLENYVTQNNINFVC